MSQRWAGIRGTPSGRKSLSQALDEAQRCGTRGWSLGRRETWIACHSQGSSAAAITFSNVPYPVACVTNNQGNSALTCLLDFCLRSRALPRNLTLNQIFDHIDYAAVMIMNQFFVFLFVITDKTSNQKKKKTLQTRNQTAAWLFFSHLHCSCGGFLPALDDTSHH